MFKVKRLNNPKLQSVRLNVGGQKPALGGQILPLYSNTYICAKKASGKSSIINYILKWCANKWTNVHIFCSTVNKDPLWRKIVKSLRKRDIVVNLFTAIVENRRNNLDELLSVIPDPVSDDESDSSSSDSDDEPSHPIIYDGEDDANDSDEPARPRTKYLAPEHIFIFDDVSTQLKDPAVAGLLKKNRHYRAKVIISSQYLNDLRPDSIMNLDVCLLGGALPRDKLDLVKQRLDLPIDNDIFYKIYEFATQERYKFLKIDIRNGGYFINFEREIMVPAL